MTLDKIKSLCTQAFDALDRFISRLLENKSDMVEICPVCDGFGMLILMTDRISCYECGGVGHVE